MNIPTADTTELEIKSLLDSILCYQPDIISLEPKLIPFIPDYIPAIGDIDPQIRVLANRSTLNAEIGLAVLDEPCSIQSDPAGNS